MNATGSSEDTADVARTRGPDGVVAVRSAAFSAATSPFASTDHPVGTCNAMRSLLPGGDDEPFVAVFLLLPPRVATTATRITTITTAPTASSTRTRDPE